VDPSPSAVRLVRSGTGLVDPELFPPSFLRLLPAVPGLVRRVRAGAAPGAVLARGPGGPFLFRGHREYRPGDDLRRVDWGVLARHDRVVVREFEEERDAVTEVWVDGSASLGAGGAWPAAARAAALACAVGLSGGSTARLGIVRAGAAVRVAEAGDVAGIRDVLVALSAEGPTGRARLADALPVLVARLPRRARWFFVSDLLSRADPGVLHRLAGRGLHGALLHLRTPSLPGAAEGDLLLARDPETGETRTVRATRGLVARVAARAQAHADRWASHAAQVGLSYLPFAPGTAPEALLRRLALEVP
jgi:uncharacterized protein (DUF58 family)